MSKSKHRPTVKHVDQDYVVTYPNGDLSVMPDDLGDTALSEYVFEGKSCAAILRFRKAERATS